MKKFIDNYMINPRIIVYFSIFASISILILFVCKIYFLISLYFIIRIELINLYDSCSKFSDNLYNENMKIFTENVRCAIGGGIAMKLGNIARIELNLVTPLLFMRSDVLQQFQFGIGVQYL